MLGFSIQKLLVLAAIVAAVWYGFKYVGRMKEVRDAEAKLRESAKGGASPAAPKTQEMVQCAVCSAYVAAQGSQNCGREDCPY